MASKIAKLNLTADRIEAVLRDGRAPARVVGGKVLPSFVEMLLQPEPGTTVSQIKARLQDISLAVGHNNVRLSQTGTHLALQIGKPGRDVVRLAALLERCKGVEGLVTALGVSEDGAPLMLKLSSPEISHVLISGATGSGKTSLAQSMILSLCQFNKPAKLGLLVLDPKRRETDVFAERIFRHLLMPVARTADEVFDALVVACDLMDARKITPYPEPRVVVYADELADLCQNGGPEIQDMLTRIAMRGREAGIHLVVCTQKPSSKAIGSELKANLPMRLVGKVASVEDARMAAGRSGSGAEKLRGGGDFIAVTTDRCIRFQAALPD
jgi:DNA segregation ATPase FtsK/SpoIIIE, S-DNA-T family